MSARKPISSSPVPPTIRAERAFEADPGAQIAGIDSGMRTLMLKGAKGRVIPVVVGKEVTNFDTLKIGDRVDVQIRDAILVKAVKASAKDDGLRKRVDTEVYAPASGSEGFGAVREVEVIATVQSINQKKKTITLRGPWHTATFDLSSEIAAYKLLVASS